MGKYSNMSILKNDDVDFLKVIANELAEMNRLKRIEILQNQPDNTILDDDLTPVHASLLTVSELKDQA